MPFFGLRAPIRSAETELLDTFFVSAVATVIAIRIALEATGYPQIGGNGLHIAHVLWGGLGMLVAIVLLLGFVSPPTRHLAALVGGAGFGSFIDELGKFVTSDNDYFFKPTAALIYAMFVALFFVTRQIRKRDLTPEENLVNAIGLSEELPAGTLTASDRQRALELLARAGESDPLVPVLRHRFLETPPEASRATPVGRIGSAVAGRYAAVAGSRPFRRVVVAFFAVWGFSLLITVITTFALLVGTAIGDKDAIAELNEATGGDVLSSWIQVIAGAIGGAMVIRGMVALRRSRAGAFRYFEIAVLVDLLLVQPFQFLSLGFAPAADVIFDLIVLAILRYLDGIERALSLRALATGGVPLATAARGG